MNCGVTMPIAKFRQITYALGYKPRCECGCCNWCLPVIPPQPYNHDSPYRPVPHFPNYRIYRNGKVTEPKQGAEFSLPTELDKDGRPFVRLERDGKSYPVALAKAVASCFMPKYEPTWQIYHKDGDRTNCDIENLVCDEADGEELGCRKPRYSWALVEGIRNGSIDKHESMEVYGTSYGTYYGIKNRHTRV